MNVEQILANIKLVKVTQGTIQGFLTLLNLIENIPLAPMMTVYSQSRGLLLGT